MNKLREHETVALLQDIMAEHEETRLPLKLPRGLVGTIVAVSTDGAACMVEFSGRDGQAYAMPTVTPEQLLLLHEAPASAASPLAA